MVGSFGFGTNNYERHCEMWHRIVERLGIKVDYVTYHPDSSHEPIWNNLNYQTKQDTGCIWKVNDDEKGDYCCEMFSSGLEIGNLVNPNRVSIDVGFGFERLLQLVESVDRVDLTSMFDQRLTPIGKDHKRTLELLISQGILPGGKGQRYICRKLLRKFIKEVEDFRDVSFRSVLESELYLMNKKVIEGRKVWHRFKNRGPEFWWETFGLLPEEIDLIRD